MLGQLLGGLGGLAIGGIADAFDNSEDEAEAERRRNQQLALQQFQNLGQYRPQVNMQGFQDAQAGAQRSAQHNVLSDLARARLRRRPEDEEGY